MQNLSFDEFISLPDKDIEYLIQEPKTCLLGLNGTMRWFTLESLQSVTPSQTQFLEIYANTTSQRLAEICDMAFSHGIHTLLIPLLNQTLFAGRSQQYAQMMIEALPNITSGGFMDEVYARHEAKVAFYGDYENIFLSADKSKLLDSFAQTTRATHHHGKHQILWGIFAQDETSAAINASINYYEEHHQRPDRESLIRQYYGCDVSPVDLYITSGKPRLFDAPFLVTGQTDLYFMTSPSLYLSRRPLRQILYDHLYSRKNEKKYTQLDEAEWQDMKSFYEANKENVMGIGTVHPDWGIWLHGRRP